MLAGRLITGNNLLENKYYYFKDHELRVVLVYAYLDLGNQHVQVG